MISMESRVSLNIGRRFSVGITTYWFDFASKARKTIKMPTNAALICAKTSPSWSDFCLERKPKVKTSPAEAATRRANKPYEPAGPRPPLTQAYVSNEMAADTVKPCSFPSQVGGRLPPIKCAPANTSPLKNDRDSNHTAALRISLTSTPSPLVINPFFIETTFVENPRLCARPNASKLPKQEQRSVRKKPM